MIRDTANDVNLLITTYTSGQINAEDTAAGKAGNLRHYLAYRSGNNDWSVVGVRYTGLCDFKYLDPDTQEPTTYISAHRMSRNNMCGVLGFNTSGVSAQSVELKLTKLKANYNPIVGTPTAEGTYKLNVHVDSNGEVDSISWVAEV